MLLVCDFVPAEETYPVSEASNPRSLDEFVNGAGLADLTGRQVCLLYTSDAADDLLCVDLGGRRIIKKKKTNTNIMPPEDTKEITGVICVS